MTLHRVRLDGLDLRPISRDSFRSLVTLEEMCKLCATSPGAHLNIFGAFLIRAKTRPEAPFCELKV